jgi:molybdate transport system substrate-binding protein
MQAVRSAVRTTVLAVAFLCLAAAGAAAQTLAVAAASDLHSALPAIAAQFEKETGHKVALTFGSSGNFFTQIQNGAPFDVMMSADIEYPRQLERTGLAERGSLYEYATGRIVLWTRNDSGIDLGGGLSVLASAGVRRIAIANPDHAPYGRAAVAAIRREQLYDRVKDKFVLGENISQAAQFVESGNAGVGVLALSLALAPALKRAGHFVEIPVSFYPAIAQAAVVVAASKQKDVARQFIAFLNTPESVRVLRSFGFTPPQAPRR